MYYQSSQKTVLAPTPRHRLRISAGKLLAAPTLQAAWAEAEAMPPWNHRFWEVYIGSQGFRGF